MCGDGAVAVAVASVDPLTEQRAPTHTANLPVVSFRADPARAESNEMLALGDIQELLGLEVLGVVPESKGVLTATNLGQPVIMTEGYRSTTTTTMTTATVYHAKIYARKCTTSCI